VIRRALVFGATFVGLGFLVLPVVAIFARVSPGGSCLSSGSGRHRRARRQPQDDADRAGARPAVGTPTAWLLAHRFRGREALVTLVELPLVLPPAVAGLGLLAAFGGPGCCTRRSRSPRPPSCLRSPSSRARLRPCGDRGLRGCRSEHRCRLATLGAGPTRTFFRVVVPLARAGLVAGAALAFARGLGEFGATIMFAGSLRRPYTDPVARVYSQFDVDFDTALAVGALLVVVSAALLVTLKWLSSISTSSFRFATSS